MLCNPHENQNLLFFVRRKYTILKCNAEKEAPTFNIVLHPAKHIIVNAITMCIYKRIVIVIVIYCIQICKFEMHILFYNVYANAYNSSVSTSNI